MPSGTLQGWTTIIRPRGPKASDSNCYYCLPYSCYLPHTFSALPVSLRQFYLASLPYATKNAENSKQCLVDAIFCKTKKHCSKIWRPSFTSPTKLIHPFAILQRNFKGSHESLFHQNGIEPWITPNIVLKQCITSPVGACYHYTIESIF